MGYMPMPCDEIRSLFLNGPPPTQEEVRHLLQEISTTDAQDSVLALIRDGELAQHHFGLFVEIVRQLQMACDMAAELLDIAEDESLPMNSRKYAVVALTTSQSQEMLVELFSRLDPTLVIAASDMPFIDMLTAIQMDPSLSCDLTHVLLDAAPDEREFLLTHHIGRIRREVGTLATAAYHHPLSESALEDVHQHMIDAIVQERDVTATDLLTALRDNASCAEARTRFQRALLRMGTKQIEDAPGRNSPDGTAYVSICDGQGAFFLVVRYRLSETHHSTVTCCIRASGEVRDAFVFPQHEEDEFESLLEEMEAEHLVHTEISIGQAATLFNDALARTKEMDRPLPSAIAPVIALFERVKPEPSSPLDRRRGKECRENMEQLLSLPHYISWFFDAGDLTGHGIMPPENEADEDWYQYAASVLSNTPLKDRLLAMLSHMIQWHTWDGDTQSVHLCEVARESVSEDFSRSTLVRLMLERSLLSEPEDLDTLLSDTEDVDGIYGDAVLRTVLRRRFFANLKRPSGRHVAELDFAEVVFRQLQLAFSQLPGEKRPREDDVFDISREIATVAVQGMLKDDPADAMMKKVDRLLAKYTVLGPTERVEVSDHVMEGVFLFVDSTCQRCPSQCLLSPRKGMADIFFSPSHPALD